MTDFFSSVAEQTMRGMLSEIALQDDVARLVQIKKNWDFYRGDQVHYLEGEDRAFLSRNRDLKPEEAEAVYNRRRVHLNYTKLIVNRFINGVYGLETTRKFADNQNQEIMDDIWKRNKMRRFMTGVQRVTELEGTTAAIPRWKEGEGRIVYEKYGAQHLIPIEMPDDPSALFALILSWPAENKWGLVPDIIENTLPGARNKWGYSWTGGFKRGKSADNRYGPQKYTEIWTADHVEAYLGKDILVSTDNPYGEIPFAIFRAEDDDGTFFGQTHITDVVAVNHVINRLLTDLVEIIRVHGFSLLFITGEMTDRLILKPTTFLKLPEGKSDAKFLSPNSPIREVQDFIDWFVRRMSDVAQIPEATISGGTVSDSGFALTIKWLPYTQMIAQKRLLYRESDHDLTRLSLLVSKTHTGRGNLEGSDCILDWVDDDFIPEPQQESRARDAFLLENDVITPLDLVRREHPDLDEAQVRDKWEENVRINKAIRKQLAREDVPRGGNKEEDMVSTIEMALRKKRNGNNDNPEEFLDEE